VRRHPPQQEARIIDLKALSPHTAVIYIIPLESRLEMIASTPHGLERVSVPVTSKQLYAAAAEFRTALEDRSTYDFMDSGRQLYGWIIQPLKEHLKLPEPTMATTRPLSSDPDEIDTLVFVPDGVLRNVPMAALSDGSHYLVESWRRRVTPGLKLMEPEQGDFAQVRPHAEQRPVRSARRVPGSRVRPAGAAQDPEHLWRAAVA